LLASLRASFPDHPELAIAAYNSGSVPVRRWLDRGPHDVDLFIERIPFDETRNYVKRVLASEAAYAYLYAPAALDGMLGAAALSLAPSASLSQNAPAASLGP
jgi:soluble lytic murein transglycosylase